VIGSTVAHTPFAQHSRKSAKTKYLSAYINMVQSTTFNELGACDGAADLGTQSSLNIYGKHVEAQAPSSNHL
jgi:hypothetical protein